MTLAQWYKWAMVLPYTVPVIAGLAGRITHFRPGPVADFGVILGFAAIYQTIPYTIFLVVVWLIVKPRTVRALRRTAWLAPIVIAVPFSIAATTLESGLHWPPPEHILPGVAIYGIWALVIGYFYVILVEIGALIVRLTSRHPSHSAKIEDAALDAR